MIITSSKEVVINNEIKTRDVSLKVCVSLLECDINGFVFCFFYNLCLNDNFWNAFISSEQLCLYSIFYFADFPEKKERSSRGLWIVESSLAPERGPLSFHLCTLNIICPRQSENRHTRRHLIPTILLTEQTRWNRLSLRLGSVSSILITLHRFISLIGPTRATVANHRRNYTSHALPNRPPKLHKSSRVENNKEFDL